ncbi:MAG: DUF1800 family protein [Pyrinomonadaceae bacterium]
MFSIETRHYLRIFTAIFVLCLASFPANAQDDGDPNSPTPVLMRAPGLKRVLAVSAENGRVRPNDPNIEAFPPNSRVGVFVRDIKLMDGEGANAFRVYAEDARGRTYRFPVVDFYQVKAPTPTYALIFEMRDEIGYWDAPQTGDVLFRVSWRGMTSDRWRLGYGATGGTVRDDKVPFSQRLAYRPAASAVKNKRGNAVIQARPFQVGYRWSGDRMRFLEQSSFGPTFANDQRLRRLGLRIWLAEQFGAPYPTTPYPNIPPKPSNRPADCDGDPVVPDVPATCSRDTYTMYPMQAWFFKEAYYGNAQLRHRVAWALSQIWVISGVDTQQSRWLEEYYKILATNAFGNYRTLMREMTLNPGMGNYLDMARSTRTNPNENYAREINQLFSIGLFMLNEDGTLQLDGEGQPIPTYDQETVNNFTKVLTGWTFCNSDTGCPHSEPGIVNYLDPMGINIGRTTVGQNRHDLSAKTLLAYPGSTTTNVAACTGTCDDSLANIAVYADNSLNQTLDNIFNHPNVGPFISKILIQHLVTSDPTPAYVGRVAAVFNNNGSGVRGDLKSVVSAVLLDPEARGDAKTDPNFGKLREPVQLMTNMGRTFDVSNAALNGQSDGVFYSPTNNLLAALGQPVFYSPTVFNYYSPDYAIPGTTLLGPEFGLMTTGTSIGRANFANTMIYTGINVNGVNVPAGTKFNFAEMQDLAAADPTGNQLLDALNYKMMHNTMSPEMRSSILTAVTAINSSNSLARAQQAIYLIMTSSQYQIQR